MYFVLFLHLYQPPTQDPQITSEITQRSYLRIVELLKKYPAAKITVNLTGSLLEQWLQLSTAPIPSSPSQPSSPSLLQLIEDLKKLVDNRQVELTGTAMYHPLLPMLPTSEVVRQIELDLSLKRKIFGPHFRLGGFFPPEMVYTQKIAQIVEALDFEWLILDESAHPLSSLRGDQETPLEHQALHLGDRLYQLKNSQLKVFFRNREASLKIAFSSHLTLEKFFSHFPLLTSHFQVLAMDGETFGHHRPGMVEWLEELFSKTNSSQLSLPSYELTTLSELLQKNLSLHTIEPVTSTWGVTIEEPDQSRTFPRWQNPLNPIHNLQWQLYDLALTVGQSLPGDLEVGGLKLEVGKEDGNWRVDSTTQTSKINAGLARVLLDKALHSDQFWWGSANPCWNLKMVEKGAVLLRDSILLNPKASKDEKEKAQNLYNQIIKIGLELYGKKEISC